MPPDTDANGLPTKMLGKTGIEVTTIGVGCGSLGRGADGSINADTALATLLAALDAGVRFIDTASLYLGGAAERIVGQALRERPTLASQIVDAIELTFGRRGLFGPSLSALGIALTACWNIRSSKRS